MANDGGESDEPCTLRGRLELLSGVVTEEHSNYQGQTLLVEVECERGELDGLEAGMAAMEAAVDAVASLRYGVVYQKQPPSAVRMPVVRIKVSFH